MTDYLHDRLVAAIGDHYLIEAELGRGGMAAVFRALDLRLNRRVAVKVLPPEFAFNTNVRSRFMREAQMAAQLAHPNIVPIYSVDERQGLVYFVMALVEGDSVAKRLAHEGAMPVDDVRAIISSVADALDYAHRQGVIHRDIKPDNILLDRSHRRPMVTDFGIARAAAEEHRLTATGMAVGTPAYMSPEQAMGERELDGRSDIYSLGIVAYQMLAGETPFRATNTPAMLMKHVSEPPPPLRSKRPDVPSTIAKAVERSLAKRPEDRWRSAGELRDAMLERDMAPAFAPARVPIPEPPLARTFPPGYPEPAHRMAQRPIAAAPNAVPPDGLSRRERKAWYRQRREAVRQAERHEAEIPENKVASKISGFRRSLVGYFGITAMLLVINGITTEFDPPWFLFPAMGMMVALLFKLGSLWGDGVRLRDIFFGPVRRSALAIAHVPLAQVVSDPADSLVPRDILDGSHGATIKRAVASRQVIADVLQRMTAKEREMLPKDLETTVEALVERVASIGTTLHRLDADANGGSLGSLDSRIELLNREASSPERDRRLALLERQRSTLRDLLERRGALIAQLESASLALENLKLDLVRFRSAGVSSALEDVTSATREARAVSRDIGHLLDAQDEVRRL